MTRRTDTLPDLSDLTGQVDAQGNPLYRRDLQDTPDPARMQSMRDEIVARIDAIPANAQTARDWDNPNKYGVSDLDLYGPRDTFGLSDEQKRLAFEAVTQGRNKADGVQNLEHGHQLGGTGLDSLSQADIDALDRRTHSVSNTPRHCGTSLQRASLSSQPILRRSK